MPDIRATVNAQGVENEEQVIDVAIERGVPPEIEVARIDAAGAHEIVEDDAIVREEVGQDALPRGLVGPEAVSEDEDPVAVPDDPDVEGVQEVVAHDLWF